MSALKKVDPKTAAEKIRSGSAVLIDIRERDEYAREHIEGAVSLPISDLDSSSFPHELTKSAIFHCKSGMRTDSHCDRLATYVDGDAFMLDGGLDAWRSGGLPTVKNRKAPLEINRQVQMTAGTLILGGVALGFLVHAGFFGLSAFVGAGLFFAGASGWCGMAKLLAVMPWNRAAV